MSEPWKRALPALLGGLPVIVLSIVWTLLDGAYEPTTWYPGALILLALLATALIGLGRWRRRLTRTTKIALWALAGYAAWSYLSIAWAGLPGTALDGANRTTAFVLAFALFAILPWEPRAAFFALATYASGVGVIGLIALLRITNAEDPTPYLIDARLAEPLGYQNGAAALWAFGSVTALTLAARRQTPTALRPILLVITGLTVALGIMTQSRGWLYALPVVWLATLMLTSQRTRFVVFSLAVAAVVPIASPALAEVYEAGSFTTGDTRGLQEATAAIVAALDKIIGPVSASLGVLLALGVALTLVDVRLRPRTVTVPGGRRLVLALTAVIVALSVTGAVVAADGDPAGAALDRWAEFREPASLPGDQGSRLTSLSTGRYDIWRVAVESWSDRPVGGLGQDNFVREYLAERESSEEPRWVHSLPLRLLAHTGTVGFLLFAVFVVAAMLGALAARRALNARGARVLVAAATAPFVVWLVQGTVDWLWEYPSLSVPAFALLGMATAIRTGPGRHDVSRAHPRPLVPQPVALGGTAVGALLLVLVLLAPWLSAREADGAVADFRAGRIAQAFVRLERAADLNPLTPEPYVTEGLLALRVGDRRRAREAFLEAGDRDPDNWFIEFELGLMASEAGDPTAARRRFQRALRLKVDDPFVREALERARSRRPMTLAEADDRLIQRIEERTAR